MASNYLSKQTAPERDELIKKLWDIQKGVKVLAQPLNLLELQKPI